MDASADRKSDEINVTMEGPVRILMLFTIMNRGGAETMVMNYYRHIDRNRVQFDFMVHRQEQGVYDDEIKTMGGKIYRMIPLHPFTFGTYRKQISDFFDQHPEYRIIHGHCSESGYFVYREAARRAVPVIIAHAHNAHALFDTKWLFRTYFKHAMRPYLTQGFTCGKEAARWLLGNELGKKAILQRNAIDTLLYRFDEVVRLEVRQELHLPEDATVVGHVGRFNRQKNHEFLLEVFHKYVQELNSTAHLLLVGTGKLQKVIQKKIQQFRLTDQVHLLGERPDVNRLLQAMDLFLFPSFMEGLSVSMVEARCVRPHSSRSGFDRPSLFSFIGNSPPTMGTRNRESALYGKPTHWLLPTNSRCRLRHCAKCQMATELLLKTMGQNKIETNKKTLTIFTPTYNRAYTLHLGYEALLRQTCKDFVWLIVDDGSTDDTLEWVEKWIAERKIDIRYHYQENQGMHGAHNTAYRLIDTELNTCIDSDDYMPDDAVEKIITFWNAHGSKEVAGIIGLDADFQGNLIGTPFPSECRRTTLGGFYAQGGRGDKKLVYCTDIIKQYPEYPIFEGEKYVSLGYKYQLIDQDYPLLALNEVLVNVKYRPDGSSLNMYRQYIHNPQGFAFIRKSSMQLAPTSQRRFIEAMHYVADSLLARNPHFLSESPRKWLTFFALFPGMVWYGYIRYKTRKLS
mgnify:CR=1 FL=1